MGISVEINPSISEITENNTFDITAAGSIKLQIGANSGQTMEISIGDMRATALGGATKLSETNLTTADEANKALGAIDNALKEVSEQRANLGAFQNRLEYTIKNLNTSAENMTAAESRIRDVDMAHRNDEIYKIPYYYKQHKLCFRKQTTRRKAFFHCLRK